LSSRKRRGSNQSWSVITEVHDASSIEPLATLLHADDASRIGDPMIGISAAAGELAARPRASGHDAMTTLQGE
jgi:hypothetical protein